MLATSDRTAQRDAGSKRKLWCFFAFESPAAWLACHQSISNRFKSSRVPQMTTKYLNWTCFELLGHICLTLMNFKWLNPLDQIWNQQPARGGGKTPAPEARGWDPLNQQFLQKHQAMKCCRLLRGLIPRKMLGEIVWIGQSTPPQWAQLGQDIGCQFPFHDTTWWYDVQMLPLDKAVWHCKVCASIFIHIHAHTHRKLGHDGEHPPSVCVFSLPFWLCVHT